MPAHNVQAEIAAAAKNGAGLLIGDASSDLIGFYGTTPVDQAAALTAADGSTVDGTYGSEEAAVIANNVVRIGEIEAALVAIGILASS